MHQRPVHAGDSLSIRSDYERQKVKEFLARYRQMPEEQRRRRRPCSTAWASCRWRPATTRSAQEAFTRVAEISPDAQVVRRGPLQRLPRRAGTRRPSRTAPIQIALAELKLALRFDPARFAPFPLDDYEPQRILGAGGFGVTFLCKKRLTGPTWRSRRCRPTGWSGTWRRSSRRPACSTSCAPGHHPPAPLRLRRRRTPDAAVHRNGLFREQYTGRIRPQGRRIVGGQRAGPVQDGGGALHAAHGKGVLHRDVKPANLLVRRPEGRWEVRVIDFGLALKQSLLGSGAGSSSGNRSMTGADMAGTRHYAAPEQMGELPGVPRRDVVRRVRLGQDLLLRPVPEHRADVSGLQEGPGIAADAARPVPVAAAEHRPSGFAEVLDQAGKNPPGAETVPASPSTPNAQKAGGTARRDRDRPHQRTGQGPEVAPDGGPRISPGDPDGTVLVALPQDAAAAASAPASAAPADGGRPPQGGCRPGTGGRPDRHGGHPGQRQRRSPGDGFAQQLRKLRERPT